MSTLLKEYFDKFNNNDRLGHAFLICNTSYSDIKDELDLIVSNHFFNGKSINDVFNDYVIVEQTNSKILKDDILALQKSMMLKSSSNENRVYVIDGADKMNDYAANSLLKFLEEPEENIYAFLICENINKVLLTIKSRCHIIILEEKNDFKIENYDEEIFSKAIEIIKLLEDKKSNSEPYIVSLLNKKEDKNVISDIVTIMKYFYYSSLYYNILGVNKYFEGYEDLLKKVYKLNSEASLTNKLISINRLENMLEYNVNISLFVDEMIYRLGSDYYE